MAKIIIDPETGCWTWTAGCFIGHRPRLKIDGRYVLAAAVAWEIEYGLGPLPPGHELRRRCMARLCIRPSHHEPLPSVLSAGAAPAGSSLTASPG